MSPTAHLEACCRRYPVLSPLRQSMVAAFALLRDTFAADGQVLLAGNGGSAADCEHWAGELLKGFERQRPPIDPALPGLQDGLRCLPLTGFPALSTAMANDVDPGLVFAQLVHVLGRPADLFVGLSTSGRSANVVAAARTARAGGMRVLALTGAASGPLAELADCAIRVPERRTCLVQELHLPIYHCLCLMLEDHFFTAADAGAQHA